MDNSKAWEEVPEEERRGFLEDPVFLAYQSEVRRRLDRESDRLLSKARVSSDPDIRSSIGAYDALAKMLDLTEDEE